MTLPYGPWNHKRMSEVGAIYCSLNNPSHKFIGGYVCPGLNRESCHCREGSCTLAYDLHSVGGNQAPASLSLCNGVELYDAHRSSYPQYCPALLMW